MIWVDKKRFITKHFIGISIGHNSGYMLVSKTNFFVQLVMFFPQNFDLFRTGLPDCLFSNQKSQFG
jgi:hypothetical protein